MLKLGLFFVALEQTHAAVKQHSMSLEAALAERALSGLESDSTARDELGRRDLQASELTEHLEQLEQTLSKERQTNKDLRTQVCILDCLSHCRCRYVSKTPTEGAY